MSTAPGAGQRATCRGPVSFTTTQVVRLVPQAPIMPFSHTYVNLSVFVNLIPLLSLVLLHVTEAPLLPHSPSAFISLLIYFHTHSRFRTIIPFKIYFISVCMCLYHTSAGASQRPKEGVDPPGATNDCEQANMGTGNRIRSSGVKHSHCRAISPAPTDTQSAIKATMESRLPMPKTTLANPPSILKSPSEEPMLLFLLSRQMGKPRLQELGGFRLAHAMQKR